MKGRFHLSPRLKLILSALFLLLSAYLLWADMYFDMPTPGLAMRKSAAEYALTLRKEDRHPPYFGEAVDIPINRSDWYLTRRGDDFFVTNTMEVWNLEIPRWNGRTYHVTPMEPYDLTSVPVFTTDPYVAETAVGKQLYLVVSPDPDLARMELVQAGQTFACAETALGSGFWIGTIPQSDYDGTRPIARAYDASGALLRHK